MIPVSDEYKRQLIAGNRNWLIRIPVYLASGDGVNPDIILTNADIWDNGVTIDSSISSDSSFDIGAAIVGSLQVVINNISGNYSQYDFYNANLVLWLGVEGDLDEHDVQKYYRIGFYVVDTPSYNGSLITLNCLDNMTWFDAPFDSVTGINWAQTQTAQSIVRKICEYVGVTFNSLASFPFGTGGTVIPKKPSQQMNCREVLQYIAQMCCCYCKIDTAGDLVLTWYDKTAIINLNNYDGGTYNTTTTPYSDGDDVQGGRYYRDAEENLIWEELGDFDGGTFQQIRDKAFITQNFEIEVSTDDVVITGCRVRNTSSKDKGFDELWVNTHVEETHERYVLVIDNNPFIINATQAGNIANTVGSILAGLPVRGFTSTTLADFSYETGDMATVVDFRGNRYYTWITHLRFTTNDSEQFSCGVESVRQRRAMRFSGSVKTIAEAAQNTEDALTAYDNAVKAMDTLAQNAIGYNEYTYNSSSGKVMYRYNGSSRTGTAANPKFPNSTVVFKISGDGVFVALKSNGDIDPDGTCHYSNGYDANSGTAILNLIYAQGLNAGWITAGTMSANRIYGGTLKLGGLSNQNGLLQIVASDGTTEIGKWNNGGISVKSGKITLNNKTAIGDGNNGVYIGSDGIGLGKNSPFKVTNEGYLTATSGKIGGANISADKLSYTSSSQFSHKIIGCGEAGEGIVNIVGGQGTTGDKQYGYIQISNSGDPTHCYDGIRIYGNGHIIRYNGDGGQVWDKYLSNIPNG